jgi:hypothetical protein
MGGEFSTYREKRVVHTGFWWINLRIKHLEVLGVEKNAKGNRLEGHGLD